MIKCVQGWKPVFSHEPLKHRPEAAKACPLHFSVWQAHMNIWMLVVIPLERLGDPNKELQVVL